MHNLKVKEAILTTRKTKSDIKKELEDSISNGKMNENTDIEEMARNCMENQEDAAKIIHEFEKLLRTSMASLLPR